MVALLLLSVAHATQRAQALQKMIVRHGLAKAELPDPHCTSGVISLPLSPGGQRVCCAGYCGECGDYPTCASVRSQDSKNACCASQVLGMMCGKGAAANVCLKTCSESLPPCIMDTTPKGQLPTASYGCNKHLAEWRLTVAGAIAGAKSAAPPQGPQCSPPPQARFRSTPVGEYHVCHLKGDGSGELRCFGESSMLGAGVKQPEEIIDPHSFEAMPPIDFGRGRKVRLVAAAFGHNCVILDTIPGDVKCWGKSKYGRLGNGISVANGWGEDNADAIIGDDITEMGDNLPVLRLPGKAFGLAVGEYGFSCAVLDNVTAQVVCWGRNVDGALGLRDPKTNGAWKNVGAKLEDMGSNLVPVPLGGCEHGYVKDITSGEDHTCVLMSDGSIACWGANEDGQLGNGPGPGTSSTGEVTWVDFGGSNLTASQVSCSENYCCALIESDVKCWGDGDDMQHPQETDNIPVADQSPAITFPKDRLEVRKLIAGYNSACVLFQVKGADRTELYCWGEGGEGETGRGDGKKTYLYSDIADLKAVAFAGGHYATDVNTADEIFCATMEDDSLACWGDMSAAGFPDDVGNKASDMPLNNFWFA